MSRIGPAKSTSLFPASVFAEKKPDTEPVHDSCSSCRYYLAFNDDEEDDEDGEIDVDEEDEEDEDGELEVDDDEEDEEDEDDELGAKSRMGSCRRYPPQIDSHGDTIFPTVFKSDWCGEFLPAL